MASTASGSTRNLLDQAIVNHDYQAVSKRHLYVEAGPQKQPRIQGSCSSQAGKSTWFAQGVLSQHNSNSATSPPVRRRLAKPGLPHKRPRAILLPWQRSVAQRGLKVLHIDQISEAALHVEDALAHRQLRVRGADAQAIEEYKQYYRSSIRMFVQFVNVLHMLLVLFEPNDRDGATYASVIGGQVRRSTVGVAVLVIKGLILCILTVDLVAKMRIIGPSAFFNWAWMFKRWMRANSCFSALEARCQVLRRRVSRPGRKSHTTTQKARQRNFARRNSAQTSISSASAGRSRRNAASQVPHFLTEKGHFWDMVRCVCLALFWLDLILVLSLPQHFQFSRILRPVVFIAYSGELRRWVYLIASLVPKFVEMLCLLMLVICIWGAVGVLLFHDDISYVDNPSGENFNNIWAAGLALFALYTSESYPDIMYPSFRGSQTFARVYSVYFLSFVVGVMFILGNLIVPVLYTSFKSKRKLLALYMHVAQRRGLMAAFARLRGASDSIHFDVFTRLVQQLRPELLDKASAGTASNHDFQCAVQLMVVEMQSLAQQHSAGADTDAPASTSRASSLASRAQAAPRHSFPLGGIQRGDSSPDRLLSGVRHSGGIATMTSVQSSRSQKPQQRSNREQSETQTSDDEEYQVVEVVPRRTFATRALSVSTSNPAQHGHCAERLRDPSLREMTGLAAVPDSPSPSTRSSTVGGRASMLSLFHGMDEGQNSPVAPPRNARPSPQQPDHAAAHNATSQQHAISTRASKKLRANSRAPPLHSRPPQHSRGPRPGRPCSLPPQRGRKRLASFAVVSEAEITSQLRGAAQAACGSRDAQASAPGRTQEMANPLQSLTAPAPPTQPSPGPGTMSSPHSTESKQSSPCGPAIGSYEALLARQEADLEALDEENSLGLFEFFEVVEVLGRTYKRISRHQFLKGRGGRRLVSRLLSKLAALFSPAATLVVAAVSPASPSNARVAMLCILGVVALEKAWLIAMHGRKQYLRRTAEVVDWAILAAALTAFITAHQLGYDLQYTAAPPLTSPALQQRQLSDLWIIILCLRGFRIFNLIPNFREMLVTTRSVARFLAVAVSILLLLMYAFGLLGVFMFAQRLAYRHSAYEACFSPSGRAVEGAGGVCSALPSFADGNIHFDTFASALFTLFQVLTTSNWHEVMYLIMWGVRDKAAAALFFLAFYITAVCFIFNLVVAVFIDSFENARSAIRETRRYIRDALTGNGTDVYWKIKGLATSNTLTSFLDTPESGSGLHATIQSLSAHLQEEVSALGHGEQVAFLTPSPPHRSFSTDSLAPHAGFDEMVMHTSSNSIELPECAGSLTAPPCASIEGGRARSRHPSLSLPPAALTVCTTAAAGSSSALVDVTADAPLAIKPESTPNHAFEPTSIRRRGPAHGSSSAGGERKTTPSGGHGGGISTMNPMSSAVGMHPILTAISQPRQSAHSLRQAGPAYRGPPIAAGRRRHPLASSTPPLSTASTTVGGHPCTPPALPPHPPKPRASTPPPIHNQRPPPSGVVARVSRPHDLHGATALGGGTDGRRRAGGGANRRSRAGQRPRPGLHGL